MEATLHHDGRPYSAQGTRLKKCTPKLGSRHKTQDMHMIVYSYRCSSLNAERSTRNEGASSHCTRKLNANHGDPFVTPTPGNAYLRFLLSLCFIYSHPHPWTRIFEILALVKWRRSSSPRQRPRQQRHVNQRRYALPLRHRGAVVSHRSQWCLV